MSGYAHDTQTLTLCVDLPDGTAVQITGENDGVNGFEWAAVHVKGDAPDPLPVVVHHEVLVDGITPAECDCNGGAIWPMASDSDSGWPYVERCDDCKVFADDIDAAHFVAERESGLVIWHMLYDDVERRRWQPAVHAARMRTEGFWG
jgi:hypothetical protein